MQGRDSASGSPEWPLILSPRGSHPIVRPWADGAAVREELAAVVEQDHSVAQEGPALLRVGSGSVGCRPVRGVGCGAVR